MVKKINWKVFLIEVLIIAIFITILIQIPTFFSDKNKYGENREIIIGNSERIVEETKFKIIATDVLETMRAMKITDNLDDFSINLTLSGHFQNRENTIAQEIIGLHIRNSSEIAENLARHTIENIFSKYDSSREFRLRNYILTLFDNENEVIIANQTNVLREILDENAIVGMHEIKIKIYVFQDYVFEFEDGSNESIRINLITGEGFENLENYIDFETKIPRMNFSRISSDFVESTETYLIRFEMWK